MPDLLEKPPITEQASVETHDRTFLRRSRKLLPISFLVISILILVVVASLQNVTKTDEDQLQELQSKIDNKQTVQDYEKKTYCELLWKLKQIRLCACMVRHACLDVAAHQPYSLV